MAQVDSALALRYNPELMTLFKRRRADILRALALAVVVSLVWCVVHDRLSARAWGIPLGARSDGLLALAIVKAASEGSFLPFLPKIIPNLGAPYSGNWNDWPMTEDLLFIPPGLLTKWIGLFAAANFMVLAAQVLAALSFYFVCRVLRCRWQWAMVGSLAFAFSHYAFQRGLPHLVLTYYWHIPLCLLVCWWCGSRRGLELRGKRFWFAIAVGLVTGIQNPYYTNVFLQFLGFAALAQLFRRRPWKTIAAPIVVGTAAVAAFLLVNLDTLFYQTAHGKNTEAAYRSYQNLEIYALKPVDLLIPPPDHRSSVARLIAWNYFYDEAKKTSIKGEPFSQYLGLVGIASLLGLGLVSLKRASANPRRPIPLTALQVIWLLLFSVVGGTNGLIGQLGITLFRCTNRYSIYLLALLLLFAAKGLSRLSLSWSRWVVGGAAVALSVLVVWDQVPPRESEASLAEVEKTVSSDRTFALTMEKKLPPHAMVFQLPVMKFPESWPIQQMGDYEHFRPYLHTSSLRYSYGSDKGRAEENWQLDVERRPAPEMVAALEKIGFSAVYINRKGYADNGDALIAALQGAGRSVDLESPAGDLAYVRLTPAAHPILPESPPYFVTGWYAEEGSPPGDTWHYSNGNAELILSNPSSAPQAVTISFQLASPSPRTVEVWEGNKVLYKSPYLNMQHVDCSISLVLKPGTTTLSFKTEPPVTFPGNPDTRLLGFLLYNVNVKKSP